MKQLLSVIILISLTNYLTAQSDYDRQQDIRLSALISANTAQATINGNQNTLNAKLILDTAVKGKAIRTLQTQVATVPSLQTQITTLQKQVATLQTQVTALIKDTASLAARLKVTDKNVATALIKTEVTFLAPLVSKQSGNKVTVSFPTWKNTSIAALAAKKGTDTMSRQLQKLRTYLTIAAGILPPTPPPPPKDTTKTDTTIQTAPPTDNPTDASKLLESKPVKQIKAKKKNTAKFGVFKPVNEIELGDPADDKRGYHEINRMLCINKKWKCGY